MTHITMSCHLKMHHSNKYLNIKFLYFSYECFFSENITKWMRKNKKKKKNGELYKICWSFWTIFSFLRWNETFKFISKIIMTQSYYLNSIFKYYKVTIWKYFVLISQFKMRTIKLKKWGFQIKICLIKLNFN